MRKIVPLLTVLMLLCTLAFAQRTVTGRVLDDSGQPVERATITVKGTSRSVVADANGVFSVQVGANDVLVITASNFQEKEVRVGSQTDLTISMGRKTGVIDEVVVTALGIQRQKKELGYSTAKVSNEVLNQAKPINVATGLQGKVSGLNVTSINNGVFADVKINLRNLRSLIGDNNPMLLLDGVATPIGYLSSINPNDILDVNILKGSSAAAIYGPEGRNGVIVVTTKKGTRDGRPVVTVSHTTQIERVAFLPEFQTRFGSGSGVDAFGNGIYDPIENQQYGPEFNGALVNIGPELADQSQQMVPYTAHPEYKKKFWNTGTTFQNDVSLQGQNFFFSAQDVDIKGVVPSDKNRRTSFRFNSAREYGKLRIGFNLAYIQQNYNIVNAPGGWEIPWLVFNTPMHIPLHQYKDIVNNKFAAFEGYYNEYYPNPYWVINQHRATGRNEDLLGNTEFNFKVTNWLSVTHRASINAGFNNNKNFNRAQTVSQFTKDHRDNTLYTNRNASVGDGLSKTSRISSELFASGNKTFGDFKINYIAGHYWRQSDAKSVSVSGSNLVVPTLFNVSNRTGEPGASESNSRVRLMSVYGLVGFSYKGWANIEGTARNDWNSLLAIGNHSYFYPGVSASLVLSDAVEAIKSSSVVSYMKLRAAWNKTGSVPIGAYGLEATFAQGSGFPFGNLPGFTAGNTSPDPNLQPEFIKTTELGLELSLLRNRINLELTAFKQDNDNQIIPVSVSSATGYTNTTINAGAFTNEGIEVDLRLTPVVKFNKGNIELKTNFAYNDSKVTQLYQGVGELFVGGFTTGGQAGNWAIVGHPAFVLKAIDYQRDPLGRVIIDRNTGYPQIATVPDTFGRTLPLYTWGITPTVNWNGLSLSVVAEYKGGHYAYHGIGPDMDFTGISVRSAANGRQRFVFPNSVYWDGSKYVENTNITVSNGGYNFYTSQTYNRGVATNYITSAAAWRLREISLGYEVPMRWFGGQKVIKKLNISAVARNVLTWLPDSNQWTDPDFNFTTGNAAGINTSSITPPTRIFGGSIVITF